MLLRSIWEPATLLCMEFIFLFENKNGYAVVLVFIFGLLIQIFI